MPKVRRFGLIVDLLMLVATVKYVCLLLLIDIPPFPRHRFVPLDRPGYLVFLLFYLEESSL